MMLSHAARSLIHDPAVLTP